MNNAKPVKRIEVKASGRYDVLIGRGILNDIAACVGAFSGVKRVSVVTDSTVDGLYSDRVTIPLSEAGYIVSKYVFEAGERSKNIDTYAAILDHLAANGLTRSDMVIALGGGVTGDMAGFAAATYMRGIKYIQVPTTLLAQIDSSVGGKTAIDLKAGKNLVGAFWQPAMVICDVDTLSTLPQEVYDDGMGEMAKYMILDKDIFAAASEKCPDIVDLVAMCVDYKRRIVEADEYEQGLRKLLNLGHTPAHGIEKLSGYEITHGRAVAMGLRIIVDNSARLGYIDASQRQEILRVLKGYAREEAIPFDIADINTAALQDKKRAGDNITLLMIHGIGDVRPHTVNIDRIGEYIR